MLSRKLEKHCDEDRQESPRESQLPEKKSHDVLFCDVIDGCMSMQTDAVTRIQQNLHPLLEPMSTTTIKPSAKLRIRSAAPPITPLHRGPDRTCPGQKRKVCCPFLNARTSQHLSFSLPYHQAAAFRKAPPCPLAVLPQPHKPCAALNLLKPSWFAVGL
jgi:hypothetical protein